MHAISHNSFLVVGRYLWSILNLFFQQHYGVNNYCRLSCKACLVDSKILTFVDAMLLRTVNEGTYCCRFSSTQDAIHCLWEIWQPSYLLILYVRIHTCSYEDKTLNASFYVCIRPYWIICSCLKPVLCLKASRQGLSPLLNRPGYLQLFNCDNHSIKVKFNFTSVFIICGSLAGSITSQLEQTKNSDIL